MFEACRALGCEVIENERNAGIASALNRGIRLALDDGADAVLTLDQDSVVGPGYVANAMEHLRLARSLGIFPALLSTATINGLTAPYRSEINGLTLAWAPIQSGLLITSEVVDRIGLLDEELFIDSVDVDYFLRARSAGVPTLMIPGADITHSLGEATKWTAPKLIRSFYPGFEFRQAEPYRHYYIARNNLIVYKRHIRRAPLWCAVWALNDVLDRGRSIVFGDRRLFRAYLTASGIRAAIRGERGKIPPRVVKRSELMAKA